MLYPEINKLRDEAGSRYYLVSMAAKRARDLIDGNPVLDSDIKTNKPVSIAAEEIAQGLFTYKEASEVEEEIEAAEETEAGEPAEAVDAEAEAAEAAEAVDAEAEAEDAEVEAVEAVKAEAVAEEAAEYKAGNEQPVEAEEAL